MQLGDRIQIGDLCGDVIDLRFFQFTILEIGGWASPYPRHGAAFGRFGSLPFYPAGGCGRVDARIEAWGWQTGWDFNVVSYRVILAGEEVGVEE